MPETSQYDFSHKELLELLVQKANVTEGRWTLGMNFAFAIGNIGPNAETVSPGAMMSVLNVSLVRAQPEAPEALSIDVTAKTAQITPQPAKKGGRRSAQRA